MYNTSKEEELDLQRRYNELADKKNELADKKKYYKQ
jgi:hypothetical protein